MNFSTWKISSVIQLELDDADALNQSITSHYYSQYSQYRNRKFLTFTKWRKMMVWSTTLSFHRVIAALRLFVLCPLSSNSLPAFPELWLVHLSSVCSVTPHVRCSLHKLSPWVERSATRRAEAVQTNTADTYRKKTVTKLQYKNI